MAQQSKVPFGYRRHPDQDRAAADAAEYPVVVIGPARSGCRSRSTWHSAARPSSCSMTPTGSARVARHLLFETLPRILDRLGVADRMVDKVSSGTSVGSFTARRCLSIQSAAGARAQAARLHQLQQFYAEAYLVDRVQQLASIDLRWRNRVIGLEQRNDHAVLTIETPDGPYRMRANYVVACDGARSSLRRMVGAEFTGKVFEDQFLIADVKMSADSHRALVLVRPAVSRRAIRAVAQAAGRHLADRSAA